MDTQGFVTHLRYTSWATRHILESAAGLTPDERHRDLGNSFGGVQGTLQHIYQGDSIWFDRLRGKPTGSLASYEARSEFADFSKRWLELLSEFIAWGEKLSDSDWARICDYRDTKGNPYSTPVWQIVLHVVNHGTYHRGQVTTMLRQLGHKAVSTDLIFYYRELK